MMPPTALTQTNLAQTALVLACLLTPSWLRAQEPAATQFGDEIEIKEVLLDVVVTDSEGSVIVGLDKDDFSVVENGSAMEIQSLSFYSNRTFRGQVGGTAEAAPELEPDPRYFVLLYYRPAIAINRDVNLRARLPEAGRQTASWIFEHLLPNDYLAVLSYDSRLRLAHDFSHDAERLEYAIHQATTGRLPKKRWPSRTEDAAPEMSLAEVVDSKASKGDLFEAVSGLAENLGRIEGRKILILFGPNFPSQDSQRRRTAYETMVRDLNDNNIAVYSIDVAGQGRYPTPGRLAIATGGDYLYNNQDFVTPLRAIQQENNGYYLLSYRSSHPAGTSGFQGVAVSTVNPEFRVRARSGYSFGEP